MLFTFVSAMQRAISAKLDYWRTLHDLRTMSDRDLADLGISRSDIDFIAKKVVEAR